MKRPFQVLTDSLAPAGRLHLEITFARAAGEEQLRLVPIVLSEFGGLAVSGALSGDQIDPATSSLIAEPAFCTAESLTQIFRQVRIDAAALTCLLNTLEWTHHHVLPLSAVHISWAQIQNTLQRSTQNFPKQWQPPGYRFDISDEIDRRFNIEIEFDEKQSLELAERVNSHLGMWFTGINRGAYADNTVAPRDSLVFLTDDAVDTHEDGIVWFIDRLRANDAALDGFSNSVEKIHKTITRLRKVTIS